MKKSIGFLFAMLIWVVVMPAVAQDDGSCEAESIVERVDGIYTEYQATRTTDDSLTAFNDVENYHSSLGDILDECRNIVELQASGVVEVGSGTFDDPYAFGYFGDTGQGYLLKVSDVVRPADQYRHSWDSAVPVGYQYVALVIEVQCVSPAGDFCEVSSDAFELTGDNGNVYVYDYLLYSSSLDLKLRPGGENSGSVFFIIEADDSNLQLIFKNPYDWSNSYLVVYAAEPAHEQDNPVNDTVTITSTSTTNINVRGGPGTSYAIVGSFRNGEQATAVGRNTAGTWVQMQSGWVFAQLVRVDGNLMSLSITSP